jgi:hypothetical protein
MRTFAILSVSLLCATVVLAAGGPYVYPQKGQSAAQQQTDSSECDKWARSQSGVNPDAPPPGGPGSPGRTRGTAGGAARGAATGAAVGAIAGDAGKGAAAGAVVGGVRGRRQAKAAEQQAAAGAKDSYQRAFGACMDGRGYSVR